MGLDGEMLVLRQAASRRCGRAIVDADAGCKMLSLAQEADGGGEMHEADGCATLLYGRGDDSSDRRGRERRWGFVEMKLVVSSLRGWTERVLVRQTVASGSEKEDSPAITPRQLESRSVGEARPIKLHLRGCVGMQDGCNGCCYEINHVMSCHGLLMRWLQLHLLPATTCERATNNNAPGRGGENEKGTAGGQSLSAFCSSRWVRATNRTISHEQWQLTALAPIPILQLVNLIAADTRP